MTKKKHLLAALLVLLLVHVATAQEVDEPNNWFGVSVGLFSLDAQVGQYDLLAKRLHGRLAASYAFRGMVVVHTDVLLSTGRQSGFFFGLGAGAATDTSYLAFGPNLVIGGDIPINSRSGVSLEAAAGFYPYIALYGNDPPNEFGFSPFYPFFARLSAGYRYSF